jgi:chromosome segregation ATPase
MFKWLFPERQSLRDFRIESRDQAIRRLEELLAIEAGQVFVLRNQLHETCRRKGIRDEENNRLRGEVDELKSMIDADDYAINQYIEANNELKAKVECLTNSLEALRHWMKEKDETIVRQGQHIRDLEQLLEWKNARLERFID